MCRHFDAIPALVLVAASMALSGCSGAGASRASVTPAPTATPTPTPTPTTTTLDILPCITQTIPTDRVPPGTRTIDVVVPDTITIWPDRTLGFPNGRLLEDPVVDRTFAMVLLDMNRTGQGLSTIANIPLDPPRATKPALATFPFANLPNDNPVLDPGTGSGFTFDNAPLSAYTQVDRMGMPAVATTLILSARKNAYNDSNVLADTSNSFIVDLRDGLLHFAEPLQDDLTARGLVSCAVRR